MSKHLKLLHWLVITFFHRLLIAFSRGTPNSWRTWTNDIRVHSGAYLFFLITVSAWFGKINLTCGPNRGNRDSTVSFTSSSGLGVRAWMSPTPEASRDSIIISLYEMACRPRMFLSKRQFVKLSDWSSLPLPGFSLHLETFHPKALDSSRQFTLSNHFMLILKSKLLKFRFQLM